MLHTEHLVSAKFESRERPTIKCYAKKRVLDGACLLSIGPGAWRGAFLSGSKLPCVLHSRKFAKYVKE